MAKRSATYNTEVTKKLRVLRKEAGLTLRQAAEHFEYKQYGTITEWETGKKHCPETKRHLFINYLLNKLGLGRDEQGIKKFLLIWDELMVMEWEWQSLDLAELELYLPDRVDILSKLFEALTPRVPLERLATVRHFTGREIELKQLLDTLQPGVIVTIRGSGGIGKTALAAEAINQLAPTNNPPEQFPDGIITFNFYEDRFARNAFLHIARSFNEKIDPESHPAEVVRRALSGKQALLVLEGTENADDLDTILAERQRCGVLITTRKREHAILGHQNIDINPFNPEQGVDLLKKWAETQITNEQDAKGICELVGGLPLAIRIAGSYMTWRNENVTIYREWLKGTPLEALDHGKRRLQSVPILLEKSVSQLSKASRKILEVIGLLAPSLFEQNVIVEALAISPNSIRLPLDEVINYSLLDPIKNRYKVSHALIHIFAKQRMLAPDEVVKRLAAYYTVLTKKLNDKGTEGFTELDFERTHVLAILDNCAKQKYWETVQKLAGTIDNYLELQGHWTDRKTTLKAGLAAAQALGDRHSEGDHLGNLGVAYNDLGQVEQAIEYYQQALSIAQEIGDQHGKGKWLSNLGSAYHDLGQMEQAIEYYQQALSIAREIGDRRGEGTWLSNLGTAYHDLGEIKRAIEHYEQALLIAREIGDRRGEGNRLGNLGSAYYQLGRVERAIEYHQQALLISREIGDRHGEAADLSNLGTAYHDLGQVERTIEHYKQALLISREISDQHGESRYLSNLGTAYHDLEQVEQAIEYYQQALAISRKIGNRYGEGTRLGNLGNAYSDLGQVEQAIEYYQQALAIAREIGDRHGEGTRLGNLGNTYYNRGVANYNSGDLEQAIEFCNLALTIAREIGDRHGEGTRLGNLGNAFRALGQVEQAIEYYQQALAIFEEINSPKAEQVRNWLEELKDGNNPVLTSTL